MKTKGIMKKAIAVILGITMTLGGLMLPQTNAQNSFTTASAATFEIGGAKYTYSVEEGNKLVLNAVEFSGDTLEIPGNIFLDDGIYKVYKIDDKFLKDNKTIKTVVFPDSITYIGSNVLNGSSVENITLSRSLEHLGDYFCENCKNIKSFTCKGTNIKPGEMGCAFRGADISKIVNDKGALCIGNWLVGYLPGDAEHVKFADLGDNGTKVEYVGSDIFGNYNSIKSVDFDGIKFMGDGTLRSCKELEKITNDDKLSIQANDRSIKETNWYKESVKTGKVKLGNALIYYKTNDKVLDLTSEEMSGIKVVMDKALKDCPNIDTVRCTSDVDFGDGCFYENYYVDGFEDENYPDDVDQFPDKPRYNIKNVYLDGKKLNIYNLVEDPAANDWLKRNLNSFDNSEMTKEMVIEKTKIIFEQMDIPYYGPGNDKIGTLTPTEEFYIRLKVLNYLSIYDYDHEGKYHTVAGGLLLGGKFTCEDYAFAAHYFLECAGVEAKTFFSDPNDPNKIGVHFWNATKLGDEWFLSDDGWCAQVGHNYRDFLLSYSSFNYTQLHEMQKSYDSCHLYAETKNTEKITADRTYGDLNGDDVRTTKDVELMWDHIKGKKTDLTVKKKYADINLDGKVDVTDAVLLDNMVNGTAIDVDNIPTDGFAPGFRVAFLNGKDYDNIQYLYTDREGYIKLPNDLFEAPKGKKISYDVGMANQKVRITTPLQVVNVKWIDENEPDYSEPDSSNSDSSSPDKPKGTLGDVNGDGSIDIEDAVMVINHVNGVTALTNDETKRADIDKNSDIDIEDAVAIISHVNGVKAIE